MTLIDALVAEPAPLKEDVGGVLRVGGTRVTLDTIVGAFDNGSSPEEILLKYPSLRLTEIYAVITYYLWHQSAVDAYLKQRRHAADESRREIDSRFPREGVRKRLLARRPPRA